MAIDQSSISSKNAAAIQQTKAAYVQTYCTTQATCPDSWQIKLAENYPLAQPSASADTLAPSEKVPDMQKASVPEADLKHNGERAGMHGTAIIAAVTGQHITNPSPQMRDVQANLPPKVKAEARKARHKVLRKKHGHHYHHNAHHLADGSTRANGHHKRVAKAASHHKTGKAAHRHHSAPLVIVARSVVTPAAPEMTRGEIFFKILREEGPLKAFAYLGGKFNNPLV